VFVPYLVYFFSFIIYVSFIFENKPDKANPIIAYILLIISTFYSLKTLYFEFLQIIDEKWDYFTRVQTIWNIFDIASSILVITFSVGDLFRLDWGDDLVLIGSWAVFILWLKLFYFLRIFRPTSSFIRMIIEMFLDISVFLFIFFIGILAFSNTFYILDFHKLTDGDGEKFGITGENYFDSVTYVYMTSLGDLGYDDFNDHPYAAVYWFLFFGSTVFLQITLLNLLIAIMGDTYDKVLEVAKESQLKEICTFISEYEELFPNEVFEKSSLILIASLDSGDSKGGVVWEGKLGALKVHFQNALTTIETKLMKMNDLVHVDHEKQQKNIADLKGSVEGMEI
jgi:hypothetical protein